MKIKVGCFEYDVIETDIPIIMDGKSDYTGVIDYHQNVIKIKEGLSKDNKYEILFHEIMHAIQTYFEINFKEDNEEKIIDCFAKGICQVLKDNKELREV